MYKQSTVYGQAVRVCSTEEKLNNRLEQLNQWLVNRGYEEDHVDSEIEGVKMVERTVLFQKRDKKANNSITLVLYISSSTESSVWSPVKSP